MGEIPARTSEGQDAIDRLTEQYPDAYKHFGAHRSAAHFAVALEWPEFRVLHDTGCWMIVHGTGPSREVHWFCPEGASMPALRRMVEKVFEDRDVLTLYGTPIGEHRRAAGVLNRALGATNESGRYFLTRTQFRDYTARRAAGAS